jgi:CDP-diacylglycerol--serine O-phosphatidyltransferase
MKPGKHIPNCLTCLALLSGCAASVMALEGRLEAAAAAILVAAVLDFADGLCARLLHTHSPIGKELDSLADLVSFGVAPGMIVFHLLRQTAPALPIGAARAYVPFLAFLIVIFSALRLAKFNIDERQTSTFIGLPTPAHALFWASAAGVIQGWAEGHEAILAGLLIAGIALSSAALVAEIPMLALKIRTLAWKGNEARYILVAAAAAAVGLVGLPGLSLAIILYVLLSCLTLKRS